MKENRWLNILGWKEKELDDLRSVAYCYLRQGLYDTALIFFEAILTLSPPTLSDLRIMGALYLQLKDSEKALHFLNLAISLDPQDEISQLNRVKALFIAGKTTKAISFAKQLEENSNSSMKEKAKALLLSQQS